MTNTIRMNNIVIKNNTLRGYSIVINFARNNNYEKG